MNEIVVEFVTLLHVVLTIALIGRVLSSWLNVGPTSPLYSVVAILYQVTEPILAPIRRVLPSFGMLDLSPMVALILIAFVRNILISVATS